MGRVKAMAGNGKGEEKAMEGTIAAIVSIINHPVNP